MIIFTIIDSLFISAFMIIFVIIFWMIRIVHVTCTGNNCLPLITKDNVPLTMLTRTVIIIIIILTIFV